MYQLWLDDLYPRAKFADGLAMIEKLGHSKSIQLHRKAWIAEGKPGHATGSDAEEDVVAMPDEAMDRDTDHMEGVVEGDTAREPGLQDKRPQEPETRTLRPADDDPDEDELDALLAEVDLQNISVAPRPPLTAPEEDSFDDDMEAMAEMEGMW
ncbi:hypothetical protein K504DRAFT_464704 [Pleomassaria siparia CBS 279.74]|uniref:Chromosome segregation in meiosis protein 3 domain-containing protein n=1 Tax=Pleomassaria siparia CBS 279.74 TaxID=1314801 RepID=A0A6G1KIH2_9PLEO|nr:hypothetical protein K504DRAFT_464704 [Pleomassaria siparia CBS 279.74]